MAREVVAQGTIELYAHLNKRSIADASRQAEAQFSRAGSAVKKMSRPLGEITGQVSEFSKSLEASNARVLAFGASAGAIYALSRSFKFLLDSMIQVEKELKDINVILGASKNELQGFSKELFGIAGSTGQSFKVVATAAKELSRQGLTLEQTLLRTRDALILTRLSGMDAESAVASLTAAINTFNKSMLDSTKIVNKMANVDAAFAVSTQDLAEAMKRVGSTAQDVSVDFNQLLGAVTSLQQTTARGGPVIGNGLKSIFTRIQRTDTLDQLESLGVAVRSLQGDMLPAMQVLTNLAKKFPELTKAQQAHTSETVAGVFQMNTLRALLSDLGKGYSVYEQAVKTATSSTNEAIQRNEELNKTLDAQIKKLTARLVQAGKVGGDALLGPAAKNITNVLDSLFGEQDGKSKGRSLGQDFAIGILEGIGKFVGGPGLVVLGAIGLKVAKTLSKFMVEATLEMFGMQNQAMKIAATEKLISAEMKNQKDLVAMVNQGLASRAQLEQSILASIKDQQLLMQNQQRLVSGATQRVINTGGGVDAKGNFNFPGGRKGRSMGHIPNFASSTESMMERAGAVRGGYAPGSVRKTNIAGLGSVTYNSAESIKHVPGFAQPFINPPSYSRAGKAHQKKSIKETGIDPYASYGVVPNFVQYRPVSTRMAKKAGLQKELTMTELVDMVRSGPGKGGRTFSVTFIDSKGAVQTQSGQRAKRENYGRGRASHYEEDGPFGYLRWNPMDQSKGAKGNNPKAWREADISRIISISFDKQKYSVNPGKIGPDGLPTMVLSGLARSSGHVPNFSRFGGARFPVPIMPFHGASVGKYEGYKTTKAFQKPGAKGGSSFENYRDFNNALSRTFGGNLKDNVVYPGQIGSTARSQGLASLLGPTIGVQNVLAHPAYQKFSKMATPLGFQPNKGSVTELLQSVVNQAPKNALGYYRSKDYSNLFEELVGIGGGVGLANPGFGIKGASNFMGTAGLPTVEGMMKHGGQTRFMEIKASDSADNMSRLLGKSMQLYPDKYRSLAQRYASTSDFKIIDNFLGKFSNKPKFASGMEEAAYKTGGRFVDSYMSGGHVPNFRAWRPPSGRDPFGDDFRGWSSRIWKKSPDYDHMYQGGTLNAMKMNRNKHPFEQEVFEMTTLSLANALGNRRLLGQAMKKAKSVFEKGGLSELKRIGSQSTGGGAPKYGGAAQVSALDSIFKYRGYLKLAKTPEYQKGAKGVHPGYELFGKQMPPREWTGETNRRVLYQQMAMMGSVEKGRLSNFISNATKAGYSGGFVPNFANNALAAAFSRERKASGLPGSQIYATTVDTPNYSGPVVGNKRDEPTYGSLRKAVMNHPDPARAGMSRGMVPNFVDPLMLAAGAGAVGYGAVKGRERISGMFDTELKSLVSQIEAQTKLQQKTIREHEQSRKDYKHTVRQQAAMNRGIDKIATLQEISFQKIRQGTGSKADISSALKVLDSFSKGGLIEGLNPQARAVLGGAMGGFEGYKGIAHGRTEVAGHTLSSLFKGGDLATMNAADADRIKALKDIEGGKRGALSGLLERHHGGKIRSSNLDTNQLLSRAKSVQKQIDRGSLTVSGVKDQLPSMIRDLEEARSNREKVEARKTARSAAVRSAASQLQATVQAVEMDRGIPTTKLGGRIAQLEQKRQAQAEERAQNTQKRRVANTDMRDLQSRKAEQKRLGFFGRNSQMIGQAGMGLSFLGPMLGGGIASAIGRNTKEKRQQASIAQSAGMGLGYVGMGAMIGTPLGGPGIGTAVGAGIGLIAGVIDYMAASKTTVDDVLKTYEAQTEAANSAVDAANNYTQAQLALNSALQSGAGPQVLGSLKKSLQRALVEIGDPKLISEMMAAGGDMTKVNEVTARLADRKFAQDQAMSARTGMARIGERDSFFSTARGKFEEVEAIAKAIAQSTDFEGEVTRESVAKAGFDLSLLPSEKDRKGVMALLKEFEDLEKSASKAGDELERVAGKTTNFTEQMNHLVYLRNRELLVSEKLFKASTGLAELFSSIQTTTDPDVLAQNALNAKILSGNNQLEFDRIKISQEAAMSIIAKSLAENKQGIGMGTEQQVAIQRFAMEGLQGGNFIEKGNQFIKDNFQDLSRKEQQGLLDSLYKLSIELNVLEATTHTNNELLRAQNAVQKSNRDFASRQRMTQGGLGQDIFQAASTVFNPVDIVGGPNSGFRTSQAVSGAFNSLGQAGFDFSSGPLKGFRDRAMKQQFDANAMTSLMGLLGPQASSLRDMNLSQGTNFIRRQNSQQGDMALSLFRGMRSGEIDAQRGTIKGKLSDIQSNLQSNLIKILGGNTNQLGVLIGSQERLIKATDNLSVKLTEHPDDFKSAYVDALQRLVEQGAVTQNKTLAAGLTGTSGVSGLLEPILTQQALQGGGLDLHGAVTMNTRRSTGSGVGTNNTIVRDYKMSELGAAMFGGTAHTETTRQNISFSTSRAGGVQSSGGNPSKQMASNKAKADLISKVLYQNRDRKFQSESDFLTFMEAKAKTEEVDSLGELGMTPKDFAAAALRGVKFQSKQKAAGMTMRQKMFDGDQFSAAGAQLKTQQTENIKILRQMGDVGLKSYTSPQKMENLANQLEGGLLQESQFQGMDGKFPITGMQAPVREQIAKLRAKAKALREPQKPEGPRGSAGPAGPTGPTGGAAKPNTGQLSPSEQARANSESAGKVVEAQKEASEKVKELTQQLTQISTPQNVAGSRNTLDFLGQANRQADQFSANQNFLARQFNVGDTLGRLNIASLQAVGASSVDAERSGMMESLKNRQRQLLGAEEIALTDSQIDKRFTKDGVLDVAARGKFHQARQTKQKQLTQVNEQIAEQRIIAEKEEIAAIMRKTSLVKELNGGFELGVNVTQEELAARQAEQSQRMQNILRLEKEREAGRLDEEKTRELAEEKKKLAEEIKNNPQARFNAEMEGLTNQIAEAKLRLKPENLIKALTGKQNLEAVNLETDLATEELKRTSHRNKTIALQRGGENLAISRARTAVMTGAGTHGQLAQTQNAATTAALRRGDIDVGEALRRQMASKVAANKGDYKEQILNDVADLSNKMSGHFATAWESFVTGASSGKDALKGFASAVAMEMQRLLFKHTIGRVMDNVFASAFGALGAASSAGAGARQAGGYIPKRYNSGGMVTGGSGYKDDVPAMMSGGEFVIRKSSVNKYGSGLMNALNSGSVPKMNKGGPSLAGRTIPVKSALMGEFSEVDFESAPTFAGRSGARGNFSNARSRGVSMGLANAFLMNDPDRPGRGFSRVNRRLSNRALRSDSLVQSKFRKSRADKFMSYHEYLKGEFERRQEARQNFRNQKAATLQAGMINAAVSGVIAGGMTYRNLTRGADGVANEAQEYYDQGLEPPSGGPAYIPPWAQNARGGLIKRFAMGGSNRDSVPALLMGGEYVMNRQATNKYGTSFMNRLNRGQISRFQNGGYVGGTGLFDGAGQVDNALSSDKIVRLVDLTENINRLMEESSVKEAEVREGQNPDSPESSSGGIVNHINISINTAAGQPAEADVETKTEASGGDQADDQSTERSIEDNEKLADSLRSVVLDTIVKEQRPGGLLSK